MADQEAGETPEPEKPDVTSLNDLVQELKRAVTEMKDSNGIDPAKLQELVEAATAESVKQASRQGRIGFTPDDVLPEISGRVSRLTGPARWQAILQTPAKELVPMLRRDEAVIRHLQTTSDRLTLLSALRRTPAEELDYFGDYFEPARQQSMDTKTVGEGKELVREPELSATFIERLEEPLRVLALFDTVTMPTNPLKFPTRAPRKHVAVMPEAIEPGTPKIKKLLPGLGGEIQLTATKFAGEIVTSRELEEESVIAILPYLEDELLEWLRWDLENAAINGDADGTHQDAGTAADDPVTGWDGLRKAAPATAKVDIGATGSATLVVDDVHALRATMGKYGLNPANLALLMPPTAVYSIIADPLVKSPADYGAGATLLSGEIGRIWGIPFVATDLIRNDLTAAGIVATPGVPAKTQVILVYRPGFIHGIRRNTTVQVLRELYAESDQDAVLITTRQGFANKYPGEPVVALGNNITPS